MKTTTLVVLCVLTALAAVAALPAPAAADPLSGPALPVARCQPVWVDVNNQVHVDPECLPGPGDNRP